MAFSFSAAILKKRIREVVLVRFYFSMLTSPFIGEATFFNLHLGIELLIFSRKDEREIMTAKRRWTVRDRYGNEIYLTQERWEHIIEPINHPEMAEYEEQLQETIRTGTRKQDALNARKYRYLKAFEGLAEDNTHIVAIVLFGFSMNETGKPVFNNYITTAFQKEIR